MNLTEFAKEAHESVEPVAHWNGWTKSVYMGKEDDLGDPIYNDRRFFRCSKCRYGSAVKSNYCPNCGAKMREEEQNV